MAVQAGLCQTWSEIQKTGFLVSCLKFQTDKTNSSELILSGNLSVNCIPPYTSLILKMFNFSNLGKICIQHGHVFVISELNIQSTYSEKVPIGQSSQ